MNLQRSLVSCVLTSALVFLSTLTFAQDLRSTPSAGNAVDRDTDHQMSVFVWSCVRFFRVGAELLAEDFVNPASQGRAQQPPEQAFRAVHTLYRAGLTYFYFAPPRAKMPAEWMREAEATASATEGFVVLQGSSGRRENVPSIRGTRDERFRERLIESGVFKVEGDRVVVQKDHLFASPSMAAVALMGRTANGWVDWKNAAGKTLNELKRVTASTDD